MKSIGRLLMSKLGWKWNSNLFKYNINTSLKKFKITTMQLPMAHIHNPSRDNYIIVSSFISFMIVLTNYGCINNQNKRSQGSRNSELGEKRHVLVSDSDKKNVKIQDDWILVKNAKTTKDFGIVKLKKKQDTIIIVCTGWFFYYPFGKNSNLKELTDQVNSSEMKMEYSKSYDNDFELFRFSQKNSYLKFTKEAETGKLEIVAGRIVDPGLRLVNGVRVGMKKEDFVHLYFNDSNNQFAYVHVIEFISALDGIWHYYTFKDDTLSEIRFDTDYQLNKD